MADLNIALLGGDRRELEVAKVMLPHYRLRCFGLPTEDLPPSPRLLAASSPTEALSGVDAVLLPMAGVSEEGQLYAPLCSQIFLRAEDFAPVKSGTPVLVGVASNYLARLCRELSLPLHRVAEHDLVALPNAVPTAEGALGLIMQNTAITVNNMRVLVLGFGRVGEALAIRLRALGAEVWVANRGERRGVRAESLGFSTSAWGDWAKRLGDFDVVVNTIPAAVLDKSMLLRLNPAALVLDLASGAGGVDFAAAKELGILAIHALSLPGKVAPISAGRILGRVYPQYLHTVCGLPLQNEMGSERGLINNG